MKSPFLILMQLDCSRAEKIGKPPTTINGIFQISITRLLPRNRILCNHIEEQSNYEYLCDNNNGCMPLRNNNDRYCANHTTKVPLKPRL